MELPKQALVTTRTKRQGRELERKIRDRSAKLGVLGLGYSGLHLALEMAHSGFHVTAIDIDSAKVESLKGGVSFVTDVQNEELYSAVVGGTLRATQSFAAMELLDAISICVPTPRRTTRDADLSYLLAGVEAVHNHLTPGKLVIIESTISPGTTRDTVLPILQKSGRQVGRDFFLAYSPKPRHFGTPVTRDITKVIGGMSPRCAALADLLYQQFGKRTIQVSSLESAEMVKFMETTFRSVNSALANEMATLCSKFGVDIWEVIEAAKFTPFEFMPIDPGPGTGQGQRNCTALSNLSGISRMNGFKPLLVEIAELVNSQLPAMTSSRIADVLSKNQKSINGSHILALGIAQTRDGHDVRESLSLEILKSLHEKGAIVTYSDPHVLSIDLNRTTLRSIEITPSVLSDTDCVLILTDHSAFDYRAIVANSRLVLDCRNALRRQRGDNIVAV